MNKKINHRKILETYVKDDSREDDSSRLLQDIHRKLDNSPALNGGFDKLLYTIDGIEKSQGQIAEKVDTIHSAIYHPDDGLFARIATNKALQTDSTNKIAQQVNLFDDWKNRIDSAEEACEKEADQLQLRLQQLEISIVGLEKFQSLTLSMAKWFGAALGGGLLTVLAKIIFNSIKILP